MVNSTKEVHGFFNEEKLLHESSDSEYFKNQKKCNKYHYTNEEGLKGILSKRTLWLMHSSGLNDLSEGKIILEKAKVTLKINNPMLLGTFENLISDGLDSFYSCSFSSYGNLLSQWRGYGDNIALGFDWNSLAAPKGPTMVIDNNGNQLATSGLDFVPCDYIDPSDESTCKPFVNKVVELFLNTFCDRTPSLDEIQYCALKIGAIITSVKHIGFFEEKEYKIVFYWWNVNGIIDPDTKKLRVEYKFDESCVKRIVIGPCKDQEMKICSVKRILEGFGSDYSHVEVYRSMIPFIS